MELQLAHFSVKEYLTSDRLDNNIAQSFQEVAAKASIATVCLAYLLHLDFNPDLPIREIKEEFPLAQYSARYWMINAMVAEREDETVQGFIVKFFCSHQGSYKTCYGLYRPDEPWSEESDLTSKNIASPLYYASFGGFRNAVECLLRRGADVNAQGGYYGNALHAASHQGHEAVVKLLLGSGNVDVYSKANGGRTPLLTAAINGHEAVVKLLLGSGNVDINWNDNIGWTPLSSAATYGHEAVVKLLLGSGKVEENSKNYNGQTPL